MRQRISLLLAALLLLPAFVQASEMNGHALFIEVDGGQPMGDAAILAAPDDGSYGFTVSVTDFTGDTPADVVVSAGTSAVFALLDYQLFTDPEGGTFPHGEEGLPGFGNVSDCDEEDDWVALCIRGVVSEVDAFVASNDGLQVTVDAAGIPDGVYTAWSWISGGGGSLHGYHSAVKNQMRGVGDPAVEHMDYHFTPIVMQAEAPDLGDAGDGYALFIDAPGTGPALEAEDGAYDFTFYAQEYQDETTALPVPVAGAPVAFALVDQDFLPEFDPTESIVAQCDDAPEAFAYCDSGTAGEGAFGIDDNGHVTVSVPDDIDAGVYVAWAFIAAEPSRDHPVGGTIQPTSGYHSLVRNALAGTAAADYLDYHFTPLVVAPAVGDDFFVKVTPFNALRTDLGAMMESNVRGNYVFEVCAFHGDGTPYEIFDYRLEMLGIQEDEGAPAGAGVVYATGSYTSGGQTLDRELKPADGDGCVFVDVPRFEVGGDLAYDQAYHVSFFVPFESTGKNGFYSEAINGLFDGDGDISPDSAFVADNIDGTARSGVLLVPRNGSPAIEDLTVGTLLGGGL